MPEFNLQEVRKIYETSYCETANQYLELGWKLVDTYKRCYDPISFPNHQEVHYVLAWVSDGEPVVPDDNITSLR